MTLIAHPKRTGIGAILATVFLPSVALAEDALSAGDTAWVLTSTALVLFMTVPALALFYGGLVRSKNVLSVLMQCLALLHSTINRKFAFYMSYESKPLCGPSQFDS